MFGRKRNIFGINNFDSLFNDLNSMFEEPLIIRGKNNVETGSDENGEWTKQTFTSQDGNYSISSTVRYYSSNPTTNDNTNELGKLKSQLSRAIEEQEFEIAAELRDRIKTIESNKEMINELKSKLDDAIKNEDFERAIEIRDEIKKIS